ncbi:hypothetical protein HY612_03905 [Candidatus Roizmanbacteria bacterium]|nr:hypothetical protein [Candidatus Roizmanbacteria bacterium]
MQIKTIIVEGDIPEYQIRGLENLKGINILLLTESYVAENLVKNNPMIQLDEVAKEFPNKLILKFKSIVPLAAVKLNEGYALLSEDAKILKKSKTTRNLPIINFYQRLDYYQIVPGNKLDYKEIVTTLTLLKKSQDLNLKVESIDIGGLSMIEFNLNAKKIIFTAEKDKKIQNFELETIMKQFKIEAKDFKELDLRFDKPIVRF